MLSRQPGRGHPNLTLDHATTGYRSVTIARLCSVLRSAEDSAQHLSVGWEEVSFSCHSHYLLPSHTLDTGQIHHLELI